MESIAYIDTSVMVAIALEKGGSRLERMVLGYGRLMSSTLMESEFLSVMEREGLLEDAHERLQRIDWILSGDRLTAQIRTVLSAVHLRGADLHHVATALSVFQDPSDAHFLTLDRQQARVARKLGFKVMKRVR